MSLRYAVLGLVAELDGASGYDLMRLFEMSLGNVWSATQSQIYSELGKLTDDGLIEVAAVGPRGRKEYAVTEPGRVQLHRWLAETTPKPIGRDEAMMRIFLLGRLGPEAAMRFLDEQAAALEAERADTIELERSIPWGEDDFSFYGHLVLDYGKQFTAFRRDWYRRAREQVEAREKARSIE
ncbi:PadR family transcriptional regulator [Nocardia cyriacigeorgica]|uniref:PadR family transcriptional regulator n=1 Tax=Nocardia cyriacigeorgica TaxID=135487 RepID=UPI0018944CD4|nr:PadR family transcriptional regulator [Nocardia cyriacigeorgica]MBF6101580.1 PadR family transcriptional regulator [Nocardia cyriacigeorgica]MBF6162783.1 PadR family transcriptional regulator [Nocardia cyriacigeorgica]MBF6201711.1 PadR family transcriptional regulator [Nocardia cyriacigeorgica]MBF6320600.1 PadR family transcriptional regulator [Nocardia cyriacigeorgica]MBF6518173.1 PadR family transcriptional regulator [Nocardia cyriacigeorgica]